MSTAKAIALNDTKEARILRAAARSFSAVSKRSVHEVAASTSACSSAAVSGEGLSGLSSFSV